MGKMKEKAVEDSQNLDQDLEPQKFGNVKVGDRLIKRISGGAGRVRTLRGVTVSHVTKTRFKTKNGESEQEWTKDGDAYPRPTFSYNGHEEILQPTPQLLEELEAHRFSRKTRSMIDDLDRLGRHESLIKINTVDQVNVLNYLELALKTIQNGGK